MGYMLTKNKEWENGIRLWMLPKQSRSLAKDF